MGEVWGIIQKRVAKVVRYPGEAALTVMKRDARFRASRLALRSAR
jgi:hypothetical protein